MKYIEHRFALDTNDTASQVSLSVKKGDTARRLRINLSAGGYPYHIGDDCYAVFSATKPDGHPLFNGCAIEDCVIVYDFTPQTVAAVGLMECEIILYGSGGAQLTSAGFHIIVEESNYTGLESSSEATALAALISEVQALRAEVERSTIYIGSDQPTDGTVYWLDTSSGVAYSVTANLTNVTSSNAAETVTDGKRYETVLAAAEGYVLSDVSVVMGGVDVTAEVYADGVVTIAAVTGDVVITAMATEIESVGLLTNVVATDVKFSQNATYNQYILEASEGLRLYEYEVEAGKTYVFSVIGTAQYANPYVTSSAFNADGPTKLFAVAQEPITDFSVGTHDNFVWNTNATVEATVSTKNEDGTYTKSRKFTPATSGYMYVDDRILANQGYKISVKEVTE